jgi:hypothetical protein
MTHGHRPFVAIAEAKRRAAEWGFQLIELVTDTPSPFDFAIHDEGSTRVVRVRRMKYPLYSTESIMRNCAQQIKEFREMTLLEGTIRELWVRGPSRADWHRYRILTDTIEEVIPVPHQELSDDTSGQEGEKELSDEE